MRKLSTITAPILPFPTSAHATDRRPLASFWAGLTCMALVKLHETDSAVKVSDDGHPAHFVWLPKAMLTIAKEDRGPFIVVTMSNVFAARKRLQIRFIDPARFSDDEQAQLADAVATAARARNALRNYRDPLPFPGRNAFA